MSMVIVPVSVLTVPVAALLAVSLNEYEPDP